MGAALQTGRIDLAVMVEPFVSAEKQQGGRVIGDALAGIAPRFMITGWFARDGWIEDHQDLAARFAAAIKEAAEWANAHPQESAAILARHSSIPADVASTMGRARFGTVLDPQMIKPVLDAAVRYGALDTPLDANEIVWKASK